MEDEAGLLGSKNTNYGEERLYKLDDSPIHVPTLAIPSPMFPKSLLSKQEVPGGETDPPHDLGNPSLFLTQNVIDFTRKLQP